MIPMEQDCPRSFCYNIMKLINKCKLLQSVQYSHLSKKIIDFSISNITNSYFIIGKQPIKVGNSLLSIDSYINLLQVAKRFLCITFILSIHKMRTRSLISLFALIQKIFNSFTIFIFGMKKDAQKVLHEMNSP